MSSALSDDLNSPREPQPVETEAPPVKDQAPSAAPQGAQAATQPAEPEALPVQDQAPGPAPQGAQAATQPAEPEALPVQDQAPGPAPQGAQAATSEAKQVETDKAGIVVRFAGVTAVGLVREHNEDNFVTASLTTGKLYPRNETCSDVIGERGAIFAVCDGMGGAAAGEVASQMAVDMIFNGLREGEAPVDRDALARKLVKTVEYTGRQIYDTAQSDQTRRGMGTTVTAAVLLDKVLFLAQVGDSRAYLLRKGEFKQLTKDQSLVNQLIEAGHLTEAEAESFEHSNIILQALGTAQTVVVDLTFVELRKRDRLMLCSDGLSGMVETVSLHQALRDVEDPKACCLKLIEYANAGGGHDNITVVVVDFDGRDLEEAQPGGTFGYVQYPLPVEMTAVAPVEAKKPPAEGEPLTLAEAQAMMPPPRSSARLWIAAGVGALIAAGIALSISLPLSVERPDKTAIENRLQPATSKPAADESLRKAAEQSSIEATRAPVAVRVRTDVENAQLLINGELKGPIAAGEIRTVELIPGAYRFEAKTAGSVAATVVATVRPETPLEISLELPSGTADMREGKASNKAAQAAETTGTQPPESVSPPPTLPPEKTSVAQTGGVQAPGARPERPEGASRAAKKLSAPPSSSAAGRKESAAANRPTKVEPAGTETSPPPAPTTPASAPAPKPPQGEIPENPF